MADSTKRTIVLDTFPLSCVGKPRRGPATATDMCRDWVLDAVRSGHPVLVPAISYFEVLRELHRMGASAQIARLRAFVFDEPDRYISLTTAHLEAAAILWAQTRNAGILRASDDALDGDVLLAAQALGLGLPPNEFVVATTNVSHLLPMVPAAHWTAIVAGRAV